MLLRHNRCAWAACFVFCLAACGGDDDTSPNGPNDAAADHVDSSSPDSTHPEGSAGPDAVNEPNDSATHDALGNDRSTDTIAPDGEPSDGGQPDVRVDGPPSDGGNVDTGRQDASDADAPPVGDVQAEAQPESGTTDASDALVDVAPEANLVDGSSDSASPADALDALNEASDGDAGVDPFGCLGQPLPTTAPATVRIQGVVDNANFMAIAGATVDAFVGSAVASAGTATSAADGTFAIDLTSGGVPVDAYVRGTKAGFFDTYYYPASPIAVSPIGFTVQLIDTPTFVAFSMLAGATPDPLKGSMLVLVADCTGTTVAGATIGIDPAGSLVYLRNRLPAPAATNTDSTGAAVVFNVPPGQVTVSAAVGAMTLRSHVVTVRANTVTRTSVRP
jgi:hypothetical protein